MRTFSQIAPLRDYVKKQKRAGTTIGFVPTMGALHEGHFSLIRLAAKHADEVVVSIYVNPKQFGPDEDFDDYPRTLQDDVEKCKELGVAAVFAPTDAIMYGDETFLSLQVNELNTYMDGSSRPGFFEGILLVVNKLLNIITPDVAVFGQKDVQQFRILQQMVDEFNHDVTLVMGAIIRADDGLALSSRNKYLSKEQRHKAPSLYRALNYVNDQLSSGANNLSLLLAHQRMELQEKGFKIDYLNLFTFEKIAPAETVKPDQKYILGAAVYMGKTRLIDNMIVEIKN